MYRLYMHNLIQTLHKKLYIICDTFLIIVVLGKKSKFKTSDKLIKYLRHFKMLFSSIQVSSPMLFLVFPFYFFRISVLKNIQVLRLIPVLLAHVCILYLIFLIQLYPFLYCWDFQIGTQPLLNFHIIISSLFLLVVRLFSLSSVLPTRSFFFFFFLIFILDKCLHSI